MEKIKKENTIQACANAFKKSLLQKSWKYGRVKFFGATEIVKQATGQQAIINSSNDELETAQQLAKFIVKICAIVVDEYAEQLYEGRQDIRIEWKGEFDAACDNFKYALDQADDRGKKESELIYTRRELGKCVGIFKEDIEQSIKEIKRIDNQDNIRFTVSSLQTLRKCRWASKKAICQTENLLRALEVQALAGIYANDEIREIVRKCDEIERDLCGNGNALLMAAYCENFEEEQFWYSLSDKIKDTKERIITYQEVFIERGKYKIPQYGSENVYKIDRKDSEKNSIETKSYDKKENFWDDEEIDIENIF